MEMHGMDAAIVGLPLIVHKCIAIHIHNAIMCF